MKLGPLEKMVKNRFEKDAYMKKWLGFAFVLIALSSCSGQETPCRQYVAGVCDLCGDKAQVCTAMKKKIDDCEKTGRCQADICQDGVKQLKNKDLQESLKAMLCQVVANE